MANGFNVGSSVCCDKFTFLMEDIEKYEKALHHGVHDGCGDRVGFNGFGAKSG
jgi:hypothetical protein